MCLHAELVRVNLARRQRAKKQRRTPNVAYISREKRVPVASPKDAAVHFYVYEKRLNN